MIDSIERRSIYILVSEMTGRPYEGKALIHLFRKLRQRAGIEDVYFQEIRKTAGSELGNRGAMETYISSIPGHAR